MAAHGGRTGGGPWQQAAATAVWAVTRTVLLLTVFKVIPVRGPDVTSDVSVIYHGWFRVLADGTFPVGDVTWQYPPGAALAVLSPGLLPWLGYATAFFVLACVADAVTFVLLLRAGRRPDRRAAGVWFWVLGLPLLGPTAYARYDVMVTAVVVAAALVAARRPGTAGALTGLGAMLKGWPALLLLGAPRGRGSRAMWGWAAVVAGLLTLAFTVSMPGALGFVTAQRDRGTEVESLGGLVFHVARQFGWEGQVGLHYGSIEFLGPGVPQVSSAALVLTAVAFGWLLLWRWRAVEWTATTPADAAFTAVLLFVTTSRVISPQYMVWLLGLGAVCVGLRAGRMTAPAVLVPAATGLTLLEFPIWFDHVVASDGLGLTLIAARDGLLVAASVLAAVRLWRSTVTGPRRRAVPGPQPAGRPLSPTARAGTSATGR
ncbi:MAG TPA: glycosyltransferase family 87 protein [Streptomyces sp.]|nr:glycosyltransferase family 87 protein [Streptomyces sp.]